MSGSILCTDVLVVGGGTSGCAAALAARREGAKVVVVESEPALGGIATRGGIHRYYWGSGGGLQSMIDDRTNAIGGLFGGNPSGFHPEARRIAIGQWFDEAQIEAICDAAVYEVLMENTRVMGVRALTPRGKIEIRAKIAIDCTGNGYLVRLAGGEMRYGRETDGLYHNYSLVPKRNKNGQLSYDNLDAGWVDPYDPWDVSRAYFEAREWIHQAYADGLHYWSVSSLLGIREGGLTKGEFTLGVEDYVEDRRFSDVIARSFSHFDNHGRDIGNESDFFQVWVAVLGLFTKGIWCDIPYRCLLPERLDHVLVGCRALSVDRDVAFGVRMQKDLQKTGEAAGIAAAMCVREGVSPKRLNVKDLQAKLVAANVLEEADLSRTESRNFVFRGGALHQKALSASAAERHIAELIACFDSDYRGQAIWLLSRQKGNGQVNTLLAEAMHGRPGIRTGAAVALALLGDDRAEPRLLEWLASREPAKLIGQMKSEPLWIVALILLRLLKSAAALEEALSLLDEDLPAERYTYVLKYFSDIAGRLSSEDRQRLRDRLKSWLGESDAGEHYRMRDERKMSLRWSLELHAAGILHQCGDRQAAEAICRKYQSENKAYARNAANVAANRIAGTAQPYGTGPACLGVFDVAVIGGGVAGAIRAAEIARRGKSVVLIEKSGSLMQEITRNGQNRCRSFASAEGAAKAFFRLLLDLSAVKEDRIEPVLAQLAADRFLQREQVAVLFESRYIGQEPGPNGALIVKIANKQGENYVTAAEVADCSRTPEGNPGDDAASAEIVYTGTLIHCLCDFDRFSRMPGAEGDVELRIRPGFYEAEAHLDIAFPQGGRGSAEQTLTHGIGKAMAWLRETGVLEEGSALVYLGDEPWHRAEPDRAEGDTPQERWAIRDRYIDRFIAAGGGS